MRWATRAGVHIDRAACAWLIRRFVDPGAEFVFVTDPSEVPPDAVGFDMRGEELSHHDGDCTFETILRRHEIADPVLWRIAEIVHEADLDDQRYDAPEAAALDVVMRGLSMVGDDAAILAVTSSFFTDAPIAVLPASRQDTSSGAFALTAVALRARLPHRPRGPGAAVCADRPAGRCGGVRPWTCTCTDRRPPATDMWQLEEEERPK